jgi:hypothetical protein
MAHRPGCSMLQNHANLRNDCTCDSQHIVQWQLYGQLIAAHVEMRVGPVPVGTSRFSSIECTMAMLLDVMRVHIRHLTERVFAAALQAPASVPVDDTTAAYCSPKEGPEVDPVPAWPQDSVQNLNILLHGRHSYCSCWQQESPQINAKATR